MSLYERLCGRYENGQSDENLAKIAIDGFAALMVEYAAGAVSRQAIIDTIGIDAGEEVQLDDMLAKYNNAADKKEMLTRFRSMLHLSELNYPGYGLPSQLEAAILAI